MANGGKKSGGNSSGNNRKKSSKSSGSKGRKKGGKFTLNTPMAALLAGIIIALCVITLFITNRLTGADRENAASEFAWALPSENVEENPFVPVPDEAESESVSEPKSSKRRVVVPAYEEEAEEKNQRTYANGITLAPRPGVVLISSEDAESKVDEKTGEATEQKKSEIVEEIPVEAENANVIATQSEGDGQKTVVKESASDVQSAQSAQSSQSNQAGAALQTQVQESKTRITTPPKPPLTTATDRPSFPAASSPKKSSKKSSGESKKGDAKNEKSLAERIPKAVSGAKICFVIDDGGLHADNVKKYTSLSFPITIAVLPKLSESDACAKAVVASGKELILHQPMQAHDYPSGKTPNPGPGAVLPDMSMDEAAAAVRENLSSLGSGIVGLNNHEGSLICENADLMAAVLSVAQEKKVYFFDSRTTSQSTVPNVAESLGMKYIGRFAPFLDNEIDRNAMLDMICKGLEVANRDGYAVMIGHVDKSVEILPALLKEIYPLLVEAGYTITTPSKL